MGQSISSFLPWNRKGVTPRWGGSVDFREMAHNQSTPFPDDAEGGALP